MGSQDGNDLAVQHRIVVGVDGSEDSKEALRWAAGEARMRHATLHLVRAWQVSPFVTVAMYVPPEVGEQASRAVEKTLRDAAEEMAGKLRGVEITMEARQGPPTQVLLEASADADLLVLGTRGHSKVSSLILGSVSRYVTTHAACPVVVVRRAPGRPATSGGLGHVKRPA